MRRARGGGEWSFLRRVSGRFDNRLVSQIGAFSRWQRQFDREVCRTRSHHRNEENNEPAAEIFQKSQQAAPGHNCVTARSAGSVAVQRGENPVPIQREVQTNEHHENKI